MKEIVLKRIQELEDILKKLKTAHSQKWHELASGENYNCGNTEEQQLGKQVEQANRALEILYAVSDGVLVISEDQKAAVQNTIKELNKKLEETEANLGDALTIQNTMTFAEELLSHGFINSCTYDSTICTCSCHKNPGLKVSHFVPCCQSVCPKCKKHILFGRLEEHLKRHPFLF